MKYRDVAKRFRRLGCVPREGKGDHEIWVCPCGQHQVVTRDGKWWLAEVEPLGYATQAKRLSDIREQIADLIETVTGSAPGVDDVNVEIRLPLVVQDHLARAARSREQASASKREAALHARALADEGLTVRDIGAVLGISHQRAQQLKTG